MLTLKEAAESLGINPGTLRVQVHNGVLKGQKLGRDWVITRRELERYRKQHLRCSVVHIL